MKVKKYDGPKLGEDSYTFIPVNLMTSPPARGGTVHVIANNYWALRNGEELAFFNMSRSFSPKCNPTLQVANMLAKRAPWTMVKVELIPFVFIPVHYYLEEGEITQRYVLPFPVVKEG